MDGAPIFSLFAEALPGAQLHSLRGLLNSTTNMILTCMERGETFEQAVAYCQQIALPRPTRVVISNGWDASVKVAALATVLMGIPTLPSEWIVRDTRNHTCEIERARSEGSAGNCVYSQPGGRRGTGKGCTRNGRR